MSNLMPPAPKNETSGLTKPYYTAAHRDVAQVVEYCPGIAPKGPMLLSASSSNIYRTWKNTANLEI